MDVPSPAAGTVREVKVKAGDRVKEGSLIVTAGGAAAAPAGRSGRRPRQPQAPAAAGQPSAPRAAPPAGRPAAPACTGARRGISRRHPSARRPASRPADCVHASPSVRRFARELGVDLVAAVTGTGPHGRVLHEDVQKFVKATLHRRRAPQRRRARPAPLAEGRLRLVRPGRGQAALAHPQARRGQPGPQLGHDPARHAGRRGRHHRARGLPRPAQRGAGRGRGQGDAAGLPHEGLRGGAAPASPTSTPRSTARPWC